jgi:hypothetical protein
MALCAWSVKSSGKLRRRDACWLPPGDRDLPPPMRTNIGRQACASLGTPTSCQPQLVDFFPSRWRLGLAWHHIRKPQPRSVDGIDGVPVRVLFRCVHVEGLGPPLEGPVTSPLPLNPAHPLS